MTDINETIANLNILRKMKSSPEKLRQLANNDAFEDAVLWADEAKDAADTWDAERLSRDEEQWKNYRRNDGSPVYIVLTWPTGAKEITTLEGLAFSLTDYLDGFEPDEEFSFSIVEMTKEQYDNLPEFTGP